MGDDEANMAVQAYQNAAPIKAQEIAANAAAINQKVEKQNSMARAVAHLKEQHPPVPGINEA